MTPPTVERGEPDPPNVVKFAKKQRNVQQLLLLIRLSLFLSLIAIATGIGKFSYLTLYDFEESLLNLALKDFGNQVNRNFDRGLSNKIIAHELTNKYIQTWLQNGSIGSFPNGTIPGFDDVMTKVANLADLSAIFFLPLITNKTRNGFEVYAKENIDLVHDHVQIKTRPDGCTSISCGYIVSDGISSIENDKKIRAPDVIADSENPFIHFPVWQVSPMTSFYESFLLVDVHSLKGTRMKTIDEVIKTNQGAFTDIFVTAKILKPSSFYFAPITSNEPGNHIIGMFMGLFQFDNLFKEIITSGVGGIDCVLTSKSNIQYTLVFENGKVTVAGKGDLHDKNYDKYKESVKTLSSSHFKLDIYPTKSFVNSRLSNRPVIVSSSFVASVAFVGLLFTLYLIVKKRVENQLIEESNLHLADAVAKDAVLKEKKIYTRYISHEVHNMNILTFN